MVQNPAGKITYIHYNFVVAKSLVSNNDFHWFNADYVGFYGGQGYDRRWVVNFLKPLFK